MKVKAIGAGFAQGKRFSISYDDKEVTMATANNKGSFQTTFAVPPSTVGEHKVTTKPPQLSRPSLYHPTSS